MLSKQDEALELEANALFYVALSLALKVNKRKS
jgi:hypothetical protein